MCRANRGGVADGGENSGHGGEYRRRGGQSGGGAEGGDAGRPAEGGRYFCGKAC